jgi:uncharacterized protein YraI
VVLVGWIVVRYGGCSWWQWSDYLQPAQATTYTGRDECSFDDFLPTCIYMDSLDIVVQWQNISKRSCCTQQQAAD